MVLLPRSVCDRMTMPPPAAARPEAARAIPAVPSPAPATGPLHVRRAMALDEQVTAFLAWMRADGLGTGWLLASRMRMQQQRWAEEAGVTLAPEIHFSRALKSRPGVVFDQIREGSRMVDDELADLMRVIGTARARFYRIASHEEMAETEAARARRPMPKAAQQISMDLAA